MKVLTLLSLLLTACAAQSSCPADPISGAPTCVRSGGHGSESVGVVPTATAVYAADGCKMNGCEPPFTCETVSQRCERLRCRETSDCPPGFDCDLADDRCR